MPGRFHHYRDDLTDKARSLRREMTAPEAKLWHGYLRGLPLRVTRQKPLGSFIVDFYCARVQVAIEIDGDSHFSPESIRADRRRTAALAALDIRVLRFTNLDVMHDFPGVCTRIAEELGIEENPPARPLRGRVGPFEKSPGALRASAPFDKGGKPAGGKMRSMEFRSAARVIPTSSSPSTASGAGLDHFPTHAGGGGHVRAMIRELGLRAYEPVWRDMQSFTVSRDAGTNDELWVVEHSPVYTLGLAARAEHLPRMDNAIPVVKTDRGGQITYHGPGQSVVYALVDITRRGIKVRDMVCLLEQAAIDVLNGHGVTALRKPGAPGVYVDGAKIAALGLKVKRQGCYHGLSLNVDMDDARLAPFCAIDPCGYPGLAVTSLSALGVKAVTAAIGMELARRISQLLDESPEKKVCA